MLLETTDYKLPTTNCIPHTTTTAYDYVRLYYYYYYYYDYYYYYYYYYYPL